MPSDAERIAELEAQIEGYRERELTDLRARAEQAELERDHYRQEAQRNAATGRQIAAEYEKQIAELRAKVTAYESVNVRSTRGVRS